MIHARDSSTFRVVVGGGGVIGLTMANILERAGIDYILLESRPDFVPSLGASIAVQPNGARILDQLGCFEALLDNTLPVKHMSFLRPDGSFIVDHTDDVQLFGARHGYPLTFLDRQQLLRVLYGAINDKTKCRPHSKIARVDHNTDGVVVHCDDGSMHGGSIVVGTDGVRSRIRKEMWQAANLSQPGWIGEDEQKAMSAEYMCLYGIASSVPGMERVGDYHCSHDQDRSMMVVTSSTARIYFFVFAKMDQVYRDGNIPRFSPEDKAAFVEKHSSLLYEKGLAFGDIYKHAIVSELVCMEEAEYEHWTWGRFVMAGDSIHKTTANDGFGGNMGIESAAVIVNSLKRMLAEHGPTPRVREIEAALQEYPKIHQKRTQAVFRKSGKTTRIHALEGWAAKFLIYRVIPLAGDHLLNGVCETFVNAQYIEFLPIPNRSLDANMPFNQELGSGKHESRLKRLLFAVPFLAIAYYTALAMDLMSVAALVDHLALQPRLSWGTYQVQNPKSITGLKPIDDSLIGATVAFAPSILSWDRMSRIQNIQFLIDLALLYTILLIEGARRSNALTPARLSNIFALAAQRLTIGVTGPVYFMLHYVFSAPVDKLASLDFRLTDLRYTKTVLPAVVLFYFVPMAMSFGWGGYPGSPESQMAWNAGWQVYPIFAGLFQFGLANFFLKPTVDQDKFNNPLRDLRTIRITIGAVMAVSTVSWWSVLWRSPFPLAELFVPGAPSGSDLPEWMTLIRNLLQVDHCASLGAAALWLTMMYGDMLRAGMIGSLGDLLQLLVFGGITAVVAGPGAAVGLGWLHRETLLATKHHKGAITRESLAKLTEGREKKVA